MNFDLQAAKAQADAVWGQALDSLMLGGLFALSCVPVWSPAFKAPFGSHMLPSAKPVSPSRSASHLKAEAVERL